jgi:hypothetical protein
VETAGLQNLPVVEDGHLSLHLAGRPVPLLVTCSSLQRLTSLQLALEYSLLLDLPYRPAANVQFNSLVKNE